MAKNPYQVMTSVLSNYSPTHEEKMSINSFFMCRFLSNHPRSIFVGNIINRYYNQIPLNRQYDFSTRMLMGKIKFIQMPKKLVNDNAVIENICRYYTVNYTNAQEYYKLMNAETRESFRVMYDGA